MKQNTESAGTSSPPFTKNLSLLYATSLIIAGLMAVISAAGILYRDTIYPSETYAQNFVANDFITLVIGVPVLLLSMWLAYRGKLIGLLFWPGALFFGVYNYIVYAYAMPLDWARLIYLVLLALCLYCMIGLIACINGDAVRERLKGSVPEKFGGGVLVGLGVLFMAIAAAGMVTSILNGAVIPDTEMGLHITDFLIAPAWIIGGVMLWRKKPLGYVGGTGLLFQASMLFIGLIMFMLLAPMISGAPFIPGEFVQVLIYSLVGFIPFILFVRGVLKSRRIRPGGQHED